MLELPERKPRESAGEYARRVLEHNIVHLKLLPGEQLQEKALAVEIGVSRTPVREAILELRQRRILNIYPQRGTFVSYLEAKRGEDIRYLRYVFESRLAEDACALEMRRSPPRSLTTCGCRSCTWPRTRTASLNWTTGSTRRSTARWAGKTCTRS